MLFFFIKRITNSEVKILLTEEITLKQLNSKTLTWILN